MKSGFSEVDTKCRILLGSTSVERNRRKEDQAEGVNQTVIQDLKVYQHHGKLWSQTYPCLALSRNVQKNVALGEAAL